MGQLSLNMKFQSQVFIGQYLGSKSRLRPQNSFVGVIIDPQMITHRESLKADCSTIYQNILLELFVEDKSRQSLNIREISCQLSCR